jgi:hypothetical protein
MSELTDLQSIVEFAGHLRWEIHNLAGVLQGCRGDCVQHVRDRLLEYLEPEIIQFRDEMRRILLTLEAGFSRETPPAVVADWLEERGRSENAALMRGAKIQESQGG